MSSKTKDKEKYLLQVSKKIEIGDRKATIAIVDLFSNGDCDRELKFHEDQDRDRNVMLIDGTQKV